MNFNRGGTEFGPAERARWTTKLLSHLTSNRFEALLRSVATCCLELEFTSFTTPVEESADPSGRSEALEDR